MVFDILQDAKNTLHVFLKQFGSQEAQNSDGCLVENEDSIQEVQVPDVRNNAKGKGPGEEGHDPLVDILARLDFFHFKVIAEVGQVYLEQLFEQLEHLSNEIFVKCVKRHYGVLEH